MRVVETKLAYKINAGVYILPSPLPLRVGGRILEKFW